VVDVGSQLGWWPGIPGMPGMIVLSLPLYLVELLSRSQPEVPVVKINIHNIYSLFRQGSPPKPMSVTINYERARVNLILFGATNLEYFKYLAFRIFHCDSFFQAYSNHGTIRG
jgi:hypothetical protein